MEMSSEGANRSSDALHEALRPLAKLLRWLDQARIKVLNAQDVAMDTFWALDTLAAKKKITVGELGNRLLWPASSATNKVNVLVHQGLLRKERPANGNRRQVHITLTEQGIAKYRTLESEIERELDKAIEGINPAVRESIWGIITRLSSKATQPSATISSATPRRESLFFAPPQDEA